MIRLPPGEAGPKGLKGQGMESGPEASDGKLFPDRKVSAKLTDRMMTFAPARSVQAENEEIGKHTTGPHLPWIGRCLRSRRIGVLSLQVVNEIKGK